MVEHYYYFEVVMPQVNKMNFERSVIMQFYKT